MPMVLLDLPPISHPMLPLSSRWSYCPAGHAKVLVSVVLRQRELG
ncbi:hypothetical protein Gogos_005123 [Gossypium gossypioides]|uniref:Uncharacterized protein n=1 Tax=Gossypium gossypioides TaxID=34282 RepID=A0A7J9CIC0_GOSGO|nr:hypothetical protein [Gossypium gossypioides]